MSSRESTAAQILLDALEHDASGRPAFVQQACSGDPILIARVEALLRAHGQPNPLLDGGLLVATLDHAPPEQPGARIGPYKLRELLGEGGMGNVFVAEQEEPIRRKVALKIIKPGMDTRQVLSRFEAERQTLALMDHPNIAKVLDAGTTQSGRPYFVMELVRGVPITEFCDQRRLDPRRRLVLFIQVCRAIQHAHQKGIIHRDIKPSNILVTLHDELAVPKVIDFGIAKATEQPLTNQSVYTAFNQMIGTPLYMSPEQAEMNALDVDTRSDVYSLGVLLYELLTGNTPFDSATFRQAGFDQMRRLIREVDPPRPSQRVSTLDAEADSTVSNCRGVDERRLGRVLQGDLDWIVMKALEKDRNRRYESASALADDVARYLCDDPVWARPPSALYRFKKLARRKRVALATSAFILLAVIAGTLVSVWQAIRATHAEELADLRYEESRRALKQARRAVDEMYTGMAEKWLTQQPKLTQVQREFLEKALAFYQEFAKDMGSDPQVVNETARALSRVGAIHRSLGDLAAAETAYLKSVNLSTDLVLQHPDQPEFRLTLAQSRLQLAGIYRDTFRTREADEETDRANELLKKLDTTSLKDSKQRYQLAGALDSLASALNSAQRQPESETTFESAQKVWESLVKESPDEVDFQLGLGSHYADFGVNVNRWEGGHGRNAKAESTLEEAETRLSNLHKKLPDSVQIRVNLATCLVSLGRAYDRPNRHEDADAMFDRATKLWEQLVEDFPDIEQYQSALSGVLGDSALSEERQGLWLDAENHSRRALEIDKKLADRNPEAADNELSVGYCHLRLASALTRQGKYNEAREVCEQALRRPPMKDRKYKALKHSVPFSCYSIISAAIDADDQTQVAQAIDELPQAIQFVADPQRARREEHDIAERRLLIKAVIQLMRQWAPDEAEQAYVVIALSAAPVSFRDPDLALQLARRAVEVSPNEAYCRWTVGWALFRMSDWKGTIDALVDSSDNSYRSLFILAMAYWQLGDKEQARACFDRGHEWLQDDMERIENSLRRDRTFGWIPTFASLKRLRAEAATMLGITSSERIQWEQYETLLASIDKAVALGDREQALEGLETAIKRDPSKVRLRMIRAKIYSEQGRQEDALVDWKVAVEHAERPDELTTAGEVLWHSYVELAATGNPEAARTALEQSIFARRKRLAMAPDDADEYSMLAWILAINTISELQNPLESLRLVEKARAIEPENQKHTTWVEKRALWTEVAAYYRLGRWSDANASAEKACEIYQKREEGIPHVELYFFYAMSAWQMGDHLRALELFKNTYPGVHIEVRPECEALLGINPPAAQTLEILNTAIARDPSNFHLRIIRAKIYSEQLRYDDALADLNIASEQAAEPRDIERIEAILAAVEPGLSAVGKPAEARAALERSLFARRKLVATAPKDYLIYTALAWILATTEFEELRDPLEALRLVEQARAINPDSRSAMMAEVAAYYRLGRWSDGNTSAEKAWDIYQKKYGRTAPHVQVLYFQAMCKWQLGERVLAHEIYTKAVQDTEPVDPVFPVRLIRAECEALLGISQVGQGLP